MQKKSLVAIVFILSLFAALGFWYFWSSGWVPASDNATLAQLQNDFSKTNVSPSPMPLVELTIPYLRARTYESKLDALQEQSANGSYTSYLATYDSDGLAINGLLTRPVGPEPVGGWPAIVFVHGYIPPTLYATLGPQYSSHVDYFARAGFVVFKIDLRGHGESEGSPGGGYYGADYVIDVLNARAALQSSGFVNPEKIGLWGHSMAGNALLRAAVTRPEIPATVIWAGAVYTYEDMQKYGIDDNSYRPPMPTGTTGSPSQNRRRLISELYGSPSATSPFWKQMAATNFVADLKGAIQIHHAVDDTVVNIAYGRDLMQILDEKSQEPHELFEYPSGGHNLTGASYGLAMQRAVEFYKKYMSVVD